MASKVGPKGQVVIAKELRDRLGIEPGWIALQRLVDDHIEMYFLPPEHRRSLKGSLSRYTKVRVSPGKEWERARKTAWIAAAQQRIEAPEPQP